MTIPQSLLNERIKMPTLESLPLVEVFVRKATAKSSLMEAAKCYFTKNKKGGGRKSFFL